MARLAVRVTPRSPRPGLDGWRGEALAVRVSAAPEAGRANAEVCRLVAAALGIPKTRVKVVRGAASRNKELEIEGLVDEHVRTALAAPGSPEDDGRGAAS